MNRFLSRGKDIYTGEWIIGFLQIFKDNNPIGFRKETYSIGYDIGGDWGMNHIEYKPIRMSTLGQCSGMRVNEDRLLFEGDIVDVFGSLVIIKYGTYKSGLKHKRTFYGWYCQWINGSGDSTIVANALHDLVIVGNIHDNPELIEQEIIKWQN